MSIQTKPKHVLKSLIIFLNAVPVHTCMGYARKNNEVPP